MSNKRKKKQRKLNFTALDLTTEREQLEQGLELVARLLLERWEARHMEEESDMEESN